MFSLANVSGGGVWVDNHTIEVSAVFTSGTLLIVLSACGGMHNLSQFWQPTSSFNCLKNLGMEWFVRDTTTRRSPYWAKELF